LLIILSTILEYYVQHTIRSIKTKFFKSVLEIKADRRLALTGTPFVNRADDIHSLLSFLAVEPLADKGIFRRAITQPIKNGDEIGLTRLRACMGCVSLRRSKNIVDLKLVEKEVDLCSVVWPNDAHKKLYDALFGTLRTAMEAIFREGDESAVLKNYSSIFEKLLRLRQTCCSGTLVSPERRQVALKMWDDVKTQSTVKKLTAKEGLALLEKLKCTFTEVNHSLPECGICLTEMEETDCTILKGCGHVFCKICIQQVLAKSNQCCPYCRESFTKADIIEKSVAATAASAKQGESDEIKCSSDDDFGTPPKILALLEAIKSMKPDEKGVVFSQFTKYLDLIEKAMKDAGHSFVRIDGSFSAKQRISNIHQFNSQEQSPRFILCSLLAAGTGINLTRGNHAFMMDCWWNVATENQAMDRIHRIGQKRKVKITRFVMKDSVEERIVELQETKSLQAKGLLQKLKGDEKRKALLGDLKGLLELNEE
jgi:SWI/SNF-related matrix-associated actin-dependent regulator of chromatin subfamily A3